MPFFSSTRVAEKHAPREDNQRIALSSSGQAGTTQTHSHHESLYRKDQIFFPPSPHAAPANDRWGPIHAAYASRDAARMALLTRDLATLGKCQYCGTKLTDRLLERTPGTCGRRSCQRSRAQGIRP